MFGLLAKHFYKLLYIWPATHFSTMFITGGVKYSTHVHNGVGSKSAVGNLGAAHHAKGAS